ncbi:MAG: glycosyltransferase [Cetobacterium sp.]
MKKICFITTVPVTFETFILETAKYLNKNMDIQIHFISSFEKNMDKNLPRYIKYHPIDMRRGTDIKAIYSIYQIYQILKKEKFDMVQYTTPNAALYSSIASYFIKVPIRLYCQWGIRYVGFENKKRVLFKLFEKITCKYSTHIRAASKKNLEFAISEKLYSNTKGKLIGEGGTIGVDLSLFNIAKKNTYNKDIRKKFKITNEFVFGFIGRLSIDKGAIELLEAFKEISKQIITAKLFIIGNLEINTCINKDLIEWAKNNKNIIFIEQIKREELVKYYSIFDCFVHPTYREGFGMVLQEAGAMGCPIITTDIPGAGEVMINGESCLLIKSKDTEELKRGMKEIIFNHNKRINLSREAFKRTKEKFCRKKMLKNQLADYIDLLNKE